MKTASAPKPCGAQRSLPVPNSLQATTTGPGTSYSPLPPTCYFLIALGKTCHYTANSLSVKTSLVSQPQHIWRERADVVLEMLSGMQMLLHPHFLISKKLGKNVHLVQLFTLHSQDAMPEYGKYVLKQRVFLSLQAHEVLPGPAFCYSQGL